MKLKQRETGRQGVMRACLDLLAAEGIWHRRWNVGAIKVGQRFFRFGQKGDADILAAPLLGEGLCGPKFLWIETKRPGGKVTAEQTAFWDDVRNRGHYYLLIDDPSELQKWLRENRAR